MVTALVRHQGLEAVALQSGDGARAVVALQGGHVVSWVPAGGDEALYLSPRTGIAPGQAIRGGVPVVFPQFSDRGPLPRHGLARTAVWHCADMDQGKDTASLVMRLSDSAATRRHWNHGFTLDLGVRVGGDRLTMALSCRNTGDSSFDLHAALHTYLRTDAIEHTALHGLCGCRYWDALDGAHKTQRDDPLRFEGELDRVYADVAGELQLTTALRVQPRAVSISQKGFADVVVWNPGRDKCAALSDMPADGWRHMVCVEAARITQPVALQPGQAWVAEQALRMVATGHRE